MDDEQLLNTKEAIIHIAYCINGIEEFIDNASTATSVEIEDFLDYAHHLSALLKTLEYATVKPDFHELLKTL